MTSEHRPARATGKRPFTPARAPRSQDDVPRDPVAGDPGRGLRGLRELPEPQVAELVTQRTDPLDDPVWYVGAAPDAADQPDRADKQDGTRE